jgi:Cys-tRNA(Pro) deacylase
MSDYLADSTPVTRALDEEKIPYRFFKHSGAVHSLEQAAQERGQKPEQVIRSILFRLPSDEFVMVLVAGPSQISWSRLRKSLHASRITMATPEEVLEITGYPIGAVSPFGLPSPIRILIDDGVFKQTEISIGSGVRYTTIIMQSNDLLSALGEYETGSFLADEAD